jgi:hypothetical protein
MDTYTVSSLKLWFEKGHELGVKSMDDLAQRLPTMMFGVRWGPWEKRMPGGEWSLN